MAGSRRIQIGDLLHSEFPPRRASPAGGDEDRDPLPVASISRKPCFCFPLPSSSTPSSLTSEGAPPRQVHSPLKLIEQSNEINTIAFVVSLSLAPVEYTNEYSSQVPRT